MQERFVINIGRQFGSGGKSIGEKIASRLGIKLYDKELINLAAEESGLCSELFEGADEKERKGFLSALIGHFHRPLSGNYYCTNTPLSHESLFHIQSEVIRRVAEGENCIFVGRCADYILRDHPCAINLFFTAEHEDRIHRIASRTACTKEKASALIDRIDHERARYYNYYTSARTWGEAATYDLTINTSLLGEEGTTDLVVDYIRRRLGINPTK